MTFEAITFYLLAASLLGSALVGAVAARSGPAIVYSFLASMISLSGIFALLDAPVLAVAHGLMSASLGLIYYFAHTVLAGENNADPGFDAATPWRWLLAMAGIAATSGFAIALMRLTTEIPGTVDVTPARILENSSVLGASMFQDHAIGVVGIGFLLLTALLGAGHLGPRGSD